MSELTLHMENREENRVELTACTTMVMSSSCSDEGKISH